MNDMIPEIFMQFAPHSLTVGRAAMDPLIHPRIGCPMPSRLPVAYTAESI
jgi:hypothetical protein